MKYSILLAFIILSSSFQTDYSIKIAKLKYAGGGDWSGNRKALPKLANFCNKNLKTRINQKDTIV